MKRNFKYNKNVFEDIKHVDEYGNEFWYARDLQKTLKENKKSYTKNMKIIKKSYIIKPKNMLVNDKERVGR